MAMTFLPQAFEQEFLPIARENPDVMQALADHTPARHPSQLYEGILEGLLIFALMLYLMRVRFPKALARSDFRRRFLSFMRFFESG